MKLSRLRKLTWKLLSVYVIVIVLIYFADPSPEKWMRWNFWAGIGCAIMAMWVRFWAAGHLVKNKNLTVTGPYAYVKNPLYIGTFFGMLGFTFLAKGDPFQEKWYLQHLNWILFGVGLLLFIFYYIPYKKKREGDRLRKIFGDDWDLYDKAVPDYFPALTRYERASNQPWSWRAVCENSEQWTPLTVSAGVAAIIWNGWILKQVSGLIP